MDKIIDNIKIIFESATNFYGLAVLVVLVGAFLIYKLITVNKREEIIRENEVITKDMSSRQRLIVIVLIFLFLSFLSYLVITTSAQKDTAIDVKFSKYSKQILNEVVEAEVLIKKKLETTLKDKQMQNILKLDLDYLDKYKKMKTQDLVHDSTQIKDHLKGIKERLQSYE